MSIKNHIDTHPGLVRRLLRSRQQQKLAHSWLISGDDADSLNRFANDWLGTLLCRQPRDDGDACGQCEDCRQFANGTYPTLYTLKPKSKSRLIVIDDIRDLEKDLSLKTDGRIKAALIRDADRMNVEAQNAFLKTLEEPTKNTMLVLVSTRSASLLWTIRSRCRDIALRDNSIHYDFEGRAELCRHLGRLKKGAGAVVAVDVAVHIVGLLGKFKEETEAAAKKLAAERPGDESLQPAQRKRRDAEAEAEAAAAYLARREMVLSTVSAWFTQEYLRSLEITVEHLPNPELYDSCGKILEFVTSEDNADRSVRITEEAMTSLKFNVDEQLAIEEMCLRLCEK